MKAAQPIPRGSGNQVPGSQTERLAQWCGNVCLKEGGTLERHRYLGNFTLPLLLWCSAVISHIGKFEHTVEGIDLNIHHSCVCDKWFCPRWRTAIQTRLLQLQMNVQHDCIVFPVAQPDWFLFYVFIVHEFLKKALVQSIYWIRSRLLNRPSLGGKSQCVR